MVMQTLTKPSRGRRSIVHPPVAKPTGWTPKLRTTRKRTPPELHWRPSQQAQQITTKVDLDSDEESLECLGAPTPRRLEPPVIEHTPEKSESQNVIDVVATPEPPQPLYQIVAPLSEARVRELRRQAHEEKERKLMFREDLIYTALERRERRRVQGQAVGDKHALRSWY